TETRFRYLAGYVDRKAETPALRAGGERRREAAGLDELERDTAGPGRCVRLDVVERMNALVSSDRSRDGTRNRREHFQGAIRRRLLEEKEVSYPGRREATPCRVIREAAIGICADRHIRPQRLAHRKRGGDLGVERLDADLELEKADALTGLGLRLRNV